MYLYGLMAVHRAEEATGQQLGCCAGAGVGAVPRRRQTGRCGVDPVTPRLGLSERWRSGGQERAVLRWLCGVVESRAGTGRSGLLGWIAYEVQKKYRSKGVPWPHVTLPFRRQVSSGWRWRRQKIPSRCRPMTTYVPIIIRRWLLISKLYVAFTSRKQTFSFWL
jgi:hypothetical protein